jgi:autotransporter passenger strand-loop-strand repeat protein
MNGQNEAFSRILIDKAGTQFDYGLAGGATIFTGSQVVEAHGTASGSIISGGTETVAGTVVGATISTGGLQSVLSGGIATSAVAWSFGIETVSSGGTAISATLDGGQQNVAGLASTTSINAGGAKFGAFDVTRTLAAPPRGR